MITFAWPYLFFLVPLPWIIYKLLPAKLNNKDAALKIMDLADFRDMKQTKSASTPLFGIGIASLIWITLLAAAARPQIIGEPIEIAQSGRDLMLAVDLSGSMQIKDFDIQGKQIERLNALKIIASDFIDRRKGDRLGLLVFGSNAYLQAPLTFDTTTIKQFLAETEVGLAGKETAIGDAIGLAVKQLHQGQQNNKVLILLTDGNNNAGELSLEKAADIAARAGLKVHTVAIGANSMIVQTFLGPQQINPSADIDEAALKKIAEMTGGKYFRAYNTKELVNIYQEIERLEPIEQTKQHFRPTDEMYFWPLLASLVLAGIFAGFKIME